MTNDLVNNPAHYQTENGLEAIDVIDAFFVDNHYRATTFKYLARAGKKDGSPELQDLRKAAFYLNRDIERLAAEEAKRQAEIDALIHSAIDSFMAHLMPLTFPQRFLAGLSDEEPEAKPEPEHPETVESVLDLPEHTVYKDKDGDWAVRIGKKHFYLNSDDSIDDLIEKIEEDNVFDNYEGDDGEMDSTFYSPFTFDARMDAKYQAARQNGAN